MPYLGIFGLEELLSYLNEHPQIFLIAKFSAKMKILESRTNNALFGYFCIKFPKQIIKHSETGMGGQTVQRWSVDLR